MQWLNYQHLLYFWMTAREGNLTRASERLRLSPSTVSAQIRLLEEALGRALFSRQGRVLVLTEYGRVVQAYANDIFGLGEELLEVMRSEVGPRHAYRLRVGISSNLPKLMVWRLLQPALHLPDFPVHLVCIEDHADRLAADLAIHHLDIALADAPVGLAREVNAQSHLLGESPIVLMATPALAARYQERFPDSLQDAPMLLPDTRSTMRRLLEEFFEGRDLRPRVVAEFGDSALMKSFGQEGTGIFPVLSVVASEVETQYGVVTLGELPSLRERFFALVLPGKESNPAVRAILDRASHTLIQEKLSFGKTEQ